MRSKRILPQKRRSPDSHYRPCVRSVQGWAAGVPLKVAEAGIDRYFERYYRKGPRRRPVRSEFCEAECLKRLTTARAVGVAASCPTRRVVLCRGAAANVAPRSRCVANRECAGPAHGDACSDKAGRASRCARQGRAALDGGGPRPRAPRGENPRELWPRCRRLRARLADAAIASRTTGIVSPR